MTMATGISIPILSESKSYELWKLKTLAWTVVTEPSREKQAVAVALSLPEGDKRKIKEKVFGELKLDELYSENGMSILFEFLDKLLLPDELTNCLNKFEDFENFERGHKQSIREYISNFDMIFRKLEKLNIRLPSQLIAFKLLDRANITKEERMLSLVQVNYSNKENLYEEMKQALNRFGDLTEGSLGCAQTDVRLEPEWRKTLAGSSKKGYATWGTTGKIKKKLNPLGTDGRVLLCSSCGSYRHLVAECPDSWENMKKMRASEGDTKCGHCGNRNNITGKELRAGIMTELVDRSNAEEVAQEVIKLKQEICDLRDEITEIKVGKQRRKQEKSCGNLKAAKSQQHFEEQGDKIL